MAQFAETILRDEALPEEIRKYKPISPAAAAGLALGLLSVVAAITVADIGPWTFAAVPVAGLLLGVRGVGSVRRYDMAGLGAARAGVLLSGLALVGGLAFYAYVAATEVPEGYERISYEPLQPSGAGPISEAAQALDGKKVYIKGYMYPTSQRRGIKSFVLCRDNGDCCFGGKPKANDMVEITLKDPLVANYTTSLHGVGGTLRVKAETSEGGLGTVLYHIDDADVLH